MQGDVLKLKKLQILRKDTGNYNWYSSAHFQLCQIRQAQTSRGPHDKPNIVFTDCKTVTNNDTRG